MDTALHIYFFGSRTALQAEIFGKNINANEFELLLLLFRAQQRNVQGFGLPAQDKVKVFLTDLQQLIIGQPAGSFGQTAFFSF